jgi:hypothetical protein
MRLPATLLILATGIGISALVWVASDGRVALFLLPLVFGLPFVWRRRS